MTIEKLFRKFADDLCCKASVKKGFTIEICNEQIHRALSFECGNSGDCIEMYSNCVHFKITKPMPKPKVKMAPALIKSIADSKRYYVTSDLYASKDAAMNSHDKFFVKWLIDTPYEIEVDA